MTSSMTEMIQSALPLKIDKVEFQDPVLVLQGADWSLSVICPWRIRQGDDIDLSWSSADAGDRVWDLVGMSIVAASEQGPDPVFELSNVSVLDLFADTPTDPWVLRLPAITVVGPLRHE
jgi:hypothetical protein